MSQLPPPLDSDRFESVADGPEIETKVRGSRFLGQVFHVVDAATAASRLGGLRKRYYDATHHCSAVRFGPPESVEERAEDDGEPSGTAGAPILGAIHRADLFDLLVVVTRYFGGTKLGTGGLVRAYGDAARLALDAAPRRTVWHEARLILDCRYEDVGTLEAVLAREGRHLRRVEREFLDRPRFEVTLLRSQTEALRSLLIEASAGRVAVLEQPQNDAPSPGGGGPS